MKLVHARWVSISLSFVLLIIAGPTQAGGPRLAFDIPEGDADQTLRQYVSTSGIEMLYSGDEVRGVHTNPVKGIFEVSEALEMLLKGTRLRCTFADNFSFAAINVVQPDAAAGGRPASALPSNALKREPWDELPDARLNEVVVTGTLIRGVLDIMSPLQFVTRKESRNVPYATVQDALQELTTFGGAVQSEDTGGGGNFGRGVAASLRGLGAGATLVLIDGHRQAPAGTQGDFVDLSNVPWSAVERVEVLADGASALYGSDAIAGVVNIIMRKDFSGGETQLRQSVARGGANEHLIAQLLGTYWDSGQAMFAWQYTDRSALPAAARSYAANADKRPFGGDDFRTPRSSPGNIVDPWTLQPAFGISADETGLLGTTNGLEPGQINLENPWARADLLPRKRMNGAFVSARQDLTDRIELFADARFTRRDIAQRTLPAAGLLVVPRSNPFFISPYFGVPFVIVSYSFLDDLGPVIATARTFTYAANTGMRIDLGGDWRLRATESWGRERMTYRGYNMPNMPELDAALADPDPDTAFNPFGNGHQTAQATLDAIRGVQSEAAVSTIFSSNLMADGKLVELPSGPARLALGAEYRREKLGRGEIARRDFERTVSSAYTELSVPLIGSAESPQELPRLELSAAGRMEHSSDFGTTWNPKIALRWTLNRSLRLRTSWGTSFRAPRLVDAYDDSQNAALLIPMSDPRSVQGSSSWVLVRQGNNPHLRPETAETWSAGIDLAPQSLGGVKLSLGYFSIDYEERVVVPGPGSPYDVLLHEAEWKPIIQRDPSAEEIQHICQGEFFRGPVQACMAAPIAAVVDFRVRNLASTRVRGLDVNVEHSITSDYGTFDFGLNGTRLLSFTQSTSADSPALDLANTVGNPLKLRVHASLGWCQRRCDMPGFGADFSVNYSGPYQDQQNSYVRDVASFTTLDAAVSYRTAHPEGYLGDIEVVLSASNLLDEPPPFVNREIGYDVINAEPYGRVLSLSVRSGGKAGSASRRSSMFVREYESH